MADWLITNKRLRGAGSPIGEMNRMPAGWPGDIWRQGPSLAERERI